MTADYTSVSDIMPTSRSLSLSQSFILEEHLKKTWPWSSTWFEHLQQISSSRTCLAKRLLRVLSLSLKYNQAKIWTLFGSRIFQIRCPIRSGEPWWGSWAMYASLEVLPVSFSRLSSGSSPRTMPGKQVRRFASSTGLSRVKAQIKPSSVYY